MGKSHNKFGGQQQAAVNQRSNTAQDIAAAMAQQLGTPAAQQELNEALEADAKASGVIEFARHERMYLYNERGVMYNPQQFEVGEFILTIREDGGGTIRKVK